uniref:Uncharacterized protein n=1 Tax=Oryza meridionalis TaxID=40149 RepID=A0A0E0CG48_9ORYZ
MNWPGEPNRKLRGEVEVVKKYIVNNFNLPSHLSSVELYEVLGILNWRRACHPDTLCQDHCCQQGIVSARFQRKKQVELHSVVTCQIEAIDQKLFFRGLSAVTDDADHE